MELTGLAVAAVIAAFLAVVLRRYIPEQALAVGLIAGALILAAALIGAVPVLDEIQELLSVSGLSNEYVVVLFKALGVCLLTQLAADACRDAGEQGLASKAEFAGKISMLVLALPLFRKVGDIALSLIQGGTP
ncbi:MAG: stage III sporulation protein AD [Clostridia bacterium]|nr:stage III sporulation protein AD [Clostridia bacterium]